MDEYEQIIKLDIIAKAPFAKFLLKQEIYVEKIAMIVAKISRKIIIKLKKKKVGKDEFMMSLILYFLSERKLSENQLKEKLDMLDIDYHLSKLIKILAKIKVIEKDDDYYKIKVT